MTASDLDGFGLAHLPLAVGPDGVVTRLGSQVISLARLAERARLPVAPELVRADTLNPLLAEGHESMAALRARLQEVLADSGPSLAHAARPLDEVPLRLPIAITNYVDFYASKTHATNLGRILRPGGEPLTPNWCWLPIGYHGRVSTIVASPTPIRRPSGIRLVEGTPEFGPSLRLDIEAEVGFVLGRRSELGTSVQASQFFEHVAGVVLVNDWSARDLQAFEGQPLGPFLGKSFATSISPWLTPLEALTAARVPPVPQDPAPLAHLVDEDPWNLALELELELNGQVISRPPFATTYWTPGQQLAHQTSNGADVRVGDLYASGTVSGPAPDQFGSLIELTDNGARPLALQDGTTRSFLADGDVVVIRASAPSEDGGRITLGEVRGRILPALPQRHLPR